MSAPSELHERRVHLLCDLADLSGYTLDVTAYTNLRPDVCRLHHRASSILVADAKATESSADKATRQRLVRYAMATRPWTEAGLQVAFGACHDPDARGEWNETLLSCLAIANQGPSRATYAVLDSRTAVSMVVIDTLLTDKTRPSRSTALALPLRGIDRCLALGDDDGDPLDRDGRVLVLPDPDDRPASREE